MKAGSINQVDVVVIGCCLSRAFGSREPGIIIISPRREFDPLLFRSSTPHRPQKGLIFFYISCIVMGCRMLALKTLWPAFLWLSSLLLVVSSAPISENGVAAAAESDGDLSPAIEAIGRAKRASMRKKSSKPVRNLVRYRYPVQKKRSEEMFVDDDDDEDAAMAALLAERLATMDEPVDLTELAREVALDLLLEEASNGRYHQARQLEDEDEKKKRRRKKKKSVRDFEEDDEDDEEDEDDDNDKRKKRVRPSGAWAEQEEDNEGIFLPAIFEEEGNNEEDEEDALIRELANQGLSRHEIAALLLQLARPSDTADYDGGDDDDKKKKKRKRSLEWRKWPRGSVRWRRYLQDGPAESEPWSGDDGEDNRFSGRGFHRVGPSGVQDDFSRSVSLANQANRLQRPLKTKNAISLISKRSAPMESSDASTPAEESNKADEDPQQQPQAVSRKRRSLSTDETKQAAENVTSSPPAKDEKKEGPSNKAEHSGVIRKKSVNWDDYFGLDKRSNKKKKKSMNPSNEDDDEALRDYLESEYYKAIAGSLAYRRKKSNGTAHHRMRQHGGFRDAEEAMEAAFRAGEESQMTSDVQRVREKLLAELVENLSPEDLDEMANQLAEELLETLEEDEEEDDDEDEEGLAMKRSIKKKKRNTRKRGGIKKKKRSYEDRRKRNSIKHHSQGNELL